MTPQTRALFLRALHFNPSTHPILFPYLFNFFSVASALPYEAPLAREER